MPTQVGSTTLAENSNVAAPGSLVVDAPTGLAAGDLIIITTTTNVRNVTSSGFTLLTWVNGSTVNRMHTLYRVADGTEGATFTVDIDASGVSSPMCIACHAWRDAGIPRDFEAASSGAVDVSEPQTTPTVSSTSATGRVVYHRGNRFALGSDIDVSYTTAAGGVTEIYDQDIWSGATVLYGQGGYVTDSDFTGGGSQSGIGISVDQTESANATMTLIIPGKPPVGSGMVVA